MIQFECCECHQHVIAIVLDKPPEPPLCALCIAMPSWFEDPKLVAMFAPERLGNG
jgi:hypothetical protein